MAHTMMSIPQSKEEADMVDDETDIPSQEIIYEFTEFSSTANICGEKGVSFRKRVGPCGRLLLHKSLLLALAATITLLGLAIGLVFWFHNAEERHETVYEDDQVVIASTSCGPVEGRGSGGGVMFRGIPYALPPVSPSPDIHFSPHSIAFWDRWSPSSTHSRLEHCWSDVLRYNANPPACLHLSGGNITGSEDCLTLDIYTPHVSYDNPVPVVVLVATPSLWGADTDDDHFPSHLQPSGKLAKEKNVVFVVVRFRLGPQGFLPSFRSDLYYNASSEDIRADLGVSMAEASNKLFRLRQSIAQARNLGLTDLVAALTWLHLNTDHFGGDPREVTLLGWGAGASLVSALTTVRPPRGIAHLFTQAWVTGGSGLPGGETPENSLALGEKLLKASGCWKDAAINATLNDIVCLLSLPSAQLWEATQKSLSQMKAHKPGSKYTGWLSPDGYTLTIPLLETWKQPTSFYVDPPLVVGVNAHHVDDCSPVKVEELVRNASLGGVRERYSNQASMGNLLADVSSVCPLHSMALVASEKLSSPVSFYVNRYGRELRPGCGARGVQADKYSDIEAILGTYPISRPDDARFVRNMQKMFYTFVLDGRLPGLLTMPYNVYVIDEVIHTQKNYPNCEFWENVGVFNRTARLD